MKNFKTTVVACYVGYVVQAIIVNFLPLLYVQISGQFNISLEKISLLITVTFFLQLLIDLLSAKFVDKIGYRPCIIAAHVFSCAGLILLGVLPYVFADAYVGIFVAVFIYSLGSGLIEVLISPIIEACPSEKKSANMCFLHSFYCWGLVLTVLISTAFFAIFGLNNWRYAAFMWAAVPLVNTVLFSVCPINTAEDVGRTATIKQLLKNKKIWFLLVLMLCSGATEVGVAQWASSFVEKGLGVPKLYGDLLGPCLFAVCMGIGRILFAAFSEKINLKTSLLICGAGCVVSYLLLSLAPWAWLSLVGAGLIGFSVSAMWPGFLSVAAKEVPEGGTGMFAMFALAGDFGCVLGPGIVGFIGGASNLSLGLLCATVFPILLTVTLGIYKIKFKTGAK